MIATTASGKRFHALARYLLQGRSGVETERVAWTASRNLGLDDPQLAATLMQATADANPRVEVPVYHLTIAFDPNDPVTPEKMQAVADRVLSDLGLAEHQALMIAHQDRDHPHVHIMVNRVHPETGLAWERWQDRPRIEHTLRELERELGLREVAGRLYQLEGQEPPEPAQLTNGERRQALRTGEPAFPDRVRTYLPELRAARTWAELEETLAKYELRLERKGQGLVITDGEHQVKASRVARDLSLRRLEERFGMPFPGREPEIARREQTPDVRQVAGAVEELARIEAIEQQRSRASLELQAVYQRQHELMAEREHIQQAESAFRHALHPVYTDPEFARARIAAAVAELGPRRVGEVLAKEPERFGTLHTEEQPRAFGLLVAADDSRARGQAAEAAAWWVQLGRREERLITLARARVPDAGTETALSWPERAAEHLKTVVNGIQAKLNDLGEQLARSPSRQLLERSIAHVLRRMEPRELRQLHFLLTAPHRRILYQYLEDKALGRDLEEGRTYGGLQ